MCGDAEGHAGQDAPNESDELGDAKIEAKIVAETDGNADEYSSDKERPEFRRICEIAREEEAADEREEKRGIGGVVIRCVVDASKPEHDSGERQHGIFATGEADDEGKAGACDSSFDEGIVDAAGKSTDAEDLQPESEQIELGRAIERQKIAIRSSSMQHAVCAVKSKTLIVGAKSASYADKLNDESDGEQKEEERRL